MADRADRAERVEIRLTPLDPANLTSYAGRLLDAKGKPVTGATLRLIAARNRQAGPRTNFPFNWEMIRSGQIAQQTVVVRFLQGKTDESGRFEFTRVPKDTEVELVWWGDGIASGRSDHLEQLEGKERESIDIELPAPGRIIARINRKAFPKIGQFNVQSQDPANESRYISLKADQEKVEVADLAPGRYSIQLAGPFEPVPGQRGAVTAKPLAQAQASLEPGATVDLDFDAE